ncbi:MAG: hypothetical protein JWO30_283 [Fibrobacteres bacterium]|nr:hypothetical protein [Fibrobacterota bacterium]
MLAPAFAAAALLGGLTSCMRGDGFASPSDERNLRPLGTFTGKALFGTDTAARSRVIDLVHPKVAVLWRSVGHRDKVTSSGQAVIDAFPPFAFTVNLLQPPPKEVIDAPEISFGLVCLFSDVNGNGSFDRVMDPRFTPGYAVVDSLTHVYERARDSLAAHSMTEHRRLVTEFFHLEPSGLIVREDGNTPDTMWSKDVVLNNDGDIGFESFLGYVRVLELQNRWERFFAQRKKDNEYFYKEFPTLEHPRSFEIRYERSIFPKPGQEEEFNRWAKRTILAWNIFGVESVRLLQKAFVTGMLDYPFSGYGEPGQDWMAGRSITDLLLFLPTEASLDSLRDAVAGSSFRIDHSERMRQGYNLVHCDDQYVCDVRAVRDSILVYLGASEAYFNAPATPSKSPFPSPGKKPAVTPVQALAAFQGRYALNGSDTVTLADRGGELWCDAVGLGLLRVLPIDSFGVYSPKVDFQGLLTPGEFGRPDRLVQYQGDYRFVFEHMGTSVPDDLLSRIDRASGFIRVDLPDSVLGRFAGIFDYGGDTLRITLAGGDSLNAAIPGLAKLVFHAAGDSLFRCPWGEWSLAFQGFNGRSFDRVVFANGGVKKNVPAFGQLPSKLVKSVREDDSGIQWVSAQAGTGRDVSVEVNGRNHYACSDDGLFLRPGDGYLEGFSRTGPTDSISLRQGGDLAAFRIPGMQGKTAVLELRQCAERIAKSKRIRISVWAGSDRENLRLLYGDHQWMDSDTSGVYWSFDSLAVDSDPFYLVLKQEDTRDAPFRNAFDGYRLGIRP